MKVYLNEITGIGGAITSMFMSKRTWTRELEESIRSTVASSTDRRGRLTGPPISVLKEFNEWMDSLCKWGTKHITMLRYINFDITVEGLHRAGQDDWDSHAWRFNNRIIRSSTRLASFGDERSDWYQGKIIPTDVALGMMGVSTPYRLEHNGQVYLKRTNGYILKEYADEPDVKRGLYMLSIPSNFIFQICLTELAHVYKERNIHGSANPEVKQCCEEIVNQIEQWQPRFNRKLLEAIQN
jgi:hypothetical protein